jgi:hypothetical protein
MAAPNSSAAATMKPLPAAPKARFDNGTIKNPSTSRLALRLFLSRNG